MDIERILERMSPEQKAEAIQDKQGSGHKHHRRHEKYLNNPFLLYAIFLEAVTVEELEGKDVLRNNDSPGGY